MMEVWMRMARGRDGEKLAGLPTGCKVSKTW